MVTGAPGNVVVASPRPAALRDNAWGGQWQPSSVSPDAFLPSIYVARVNQSMHFPGDTNITNVSPVPAQPIGAVPSNGWSKPRIGGTTVTRAIRPFTQWNTYGN